MKIKKNYLLLLAGIVWLAAGFNILRIGIISYKSYVTLINLALSAAVFFLFWFMVFGKLVRRHTDRIVRYEVLAGLAFTGNYITQVARNR